MVPENEKPVDIPEKPSLRSAKSCKMLYEIKCGGHEGYFNMLTIHREQCKAFMKTNVVHTILAVFLCSFTTYN